MVINMKIMGQKTHEADFPSDMSHAVTSMRARDAMSWFAPPKSTQRYCHQPVSTRTMPRMLAIKVPTWAFRKTGLMSLRSSEGGDTHEPDDELHNGNGQYDHHDTSVGPTEGLRQADDI